MSCVPLAWRLPVDLPFPYPCPMSTPDLFDAPSPKPRAPAPTEQRDIYTPGRLNREARMLIERGFPALLPERVTALGQRALRAWTTLARTLASEHGT